MLRFNEKLLPLLPIFLVLYGFAAGLSNDIYLPAMPGMVQFFHTSEALVQSTLTAWGLGIGVFQLFLGPLSDHYGRRPILVLGGIIFLLGTFLCAVAPSIIVLLSARFMQGVGTCSMYLIAITTIREVFSSDARVKWLVYYDMMRSFAPLVGPMIGGYLLLHATWRASFWFIFGLGIFSLLGLLIMMPETSVKQHDAPVFSLKKLLNTYVSAFTDPYLMRHLIPNLAVLGGLVVYLTSGAFIMMERVGLSAQAFAYSQAAISVAYVLGAACVKPGYKLFGAVIVSRVGIMLSVAGGLSLVLLSAWDENVYTVAGSIALYSFGFGMCSTPLVERALAHEGLKTGLIAGLVGFMGTLGALMGSFSASLLPSTGMVSGCLMLGFATMAALVYKF